MKILIIEDEKTLADLVASRLKKKNILVEMVKNYQKDKDREWQ